MGIDAPWHPVDMELVSKTALAERLGMTRKAVDTLFATGVARDTVRSGRSAFVSEDEASRLERIQFVKEPHEPCLLVKVNGATEPDDDREWMGWKAGEAPDNPRQMDAVRQWWQVKDPDRYVGNLFIPIAAGFVLATYEVLSYKTGPGRMRSFEIKLAEPERAAHFLNHRFPLQRGPLTEPR